MPFRLQAANDRGAQPRDVLRFLRERAIADHRILRVGVDVEHRRVVERDADGFQLGGQRPREPLREAASPLRPSVAIGGHSVNGAFSRATRPPFLIDAHPQRQIGHEPRGFVATAPATCSGSAMFLAKRMTPPRPDSRARALSSTGI